MRQSHDVGETGSPVAGFLYARRKRRKLFWYGIGEGRRFKSSFAGKIESEKNMTDSLWFLLTLFAVAIGYLIGFEHACSELTQKKIKRKSK
jgi:hypothetical protein